MKLKTQQILIIQALSPRLLLPGFALFAGACEAFSQGGPPQLPVYSVTQTGATATQARSLADSLGIPPSSYSVSNGMITYLNPIFMDVPSTSVTDPSGGSNLVNQTVNKYPAIPIRLEAVDMAGLSNRTVLGSNAAVSLANAALANAGLTPASATPVVTHTFLTAFFTNDAGGVVSGSNYLDTHVSYQTTLSGVPLIGPGAQVQ